MIQFIELRITPDKKHLIIDAQVLQSSYYNNVYIHSIIIDTLKTYVNTGPSNTPLFKIKYNEDIKTIREIIDVDSIGDNMFFVYIITKGTPDAEAPCGLRDNIVTGVVYPQESIYAMSMNMINSIEGCDINRSLVDYMIKLKAFELALHAGNYTQAIVYWNEFFKSSNYITNNGCSCYGRV